MLPMPGTPPSEIQKRWLEDDYSFHITRVFENRLNQDDLLMLLKKAKEERVKSMHRDKLTEDQIKAVLKKAADSVSKYLAVLGISPEELY